MKPIRITYCNQTFEIHYKSNIWVIPCQLNQYWGKFHGHCLRFRSKLHQMCLHGNNDKPQVSDKFQAV